MSTAPAASARRPLIAIVAGAALVLVALAIYVLRLDRVGGLIGDDAWYVVLAKAIAEGSGPRLVSSAGPHVLSSVYPPGFPAVLALVFLISPHFPDNLMLLKSVSVAAIIGAGLLIHGYLVRDGRFAPPVAAAIAFGTVITPSLVFLVTSTFMSEAVYLLVQSAAVLLIGRTAQAERGRATGSVLAAGVLTAAALLIRTAGVTLIVAGVLYLGWLRRWRTMALFAAVTVLCVLPWSLYARTHAATRAQLIDHGGVMAVDYADWFWTSEAGTVKSRQVGLAQLPARVRRNVTDVAIRAIGGIFVPALFRTPGESGLEVIGLGPPEGGKIPSMGAATGTQIVSLALTLIAITGFIVACRRGVTVGEPLVIVSLGMIALWPFWTFRFVLPLTPFLLGYLVTGVETLAGLAAGSRTRLASMPASAVRIFLLLLLGLNVLDHAQYIAQAQGDARGVSWKAHFDNVSTLLDWTRQHVPADATVAADNPAFVYLWTGRHTIAISSYGDPWERWRRMGVRYVASVSDGEPLHDPRAVRRFKLQDKNIWVYELVDAPDSPVAQAAGH